MNNLRVSLLLVAVLALMAGAFVLWRTDAQAPRTAGHSTPAPQALAQALPPSPEREQTAQAKPSALELEPAAITPAETRTPDAATTPAADSTPAVTAQQPQSDRLAAADAPKAKTADQNEAAPDAAAQPTQSGTQAAQPAPAQESREESRKESNKEPDTQATKKATPPVTEAPAETKAPDTARSAEEEPAPAVVAPPDTEKPAMAAPAARKPKPVVTTTTQAEKPAEDKSAEDTPVATAPPPATDKPAIAEPAQKEPTPVVTAPPPGTGQPAMTTTPDGQPATAVPARAPATETQKPAETAPAPVVSTPAPPAKPTIVMTPLPEKRPEISKATLQRTSPAKFLFAAKKLPSIGRARAIGYYPKGCLAGGVELPVDGPHWQAMRLSRNRNWGHPELVRFIERFAERASQATGWPGILIGDMAQPRGGPLPFGHRSHQVGLDVDIWFMPMPDKRLTHKERETISATHLVKSNGKDLNPKTWTPESAKFIRAAAEQPGVERVLVNAAIKEELCRLKGKEHWSWMAKVRPWYGHDDHIHVRLKCPSDSPHCRSQPAVPGGDGCSRKELAFWFSDRVLHPRPPKHPRPAKQIMLSDLPAACKAVLNAPAKKNHLAADGG